MTKTEKARQLLQQGEIGKVLTIVSGFKLGLTKTQQRYIDIAKECRDNPHRRAFYNRLGVDVDQAEERALAAIEHLLQAEFLDPEPGPAKLYSSYYAMTKWLELDDIVPIRTSVGVPRWLPGGMVKYLDLAPHPWMIKKTTTQREYDVAYAEILSTLQPEQVYHDLLALGQGKSVAMLCFCKNFHSCHRYKVTKWLNDAGFTTEEYSRK